MGVPETIISDYGRTPEDLRYAYREKQYGHLMADETYRRLPMVPRPVLMLRGNDVMFAGGTAAATGALSDNGTDAWGYDAAGDGVEQPAAQLRTEGNTDYGRIDPGMFRRSSQLTAKDYEAVAPKVGGNSALYGAITQMAPLSLAIRPTPFQRAVSFFQRRLWGEASVGDCLLVLLYLNQQARANCATANRRSSEPTLEQLCELIGFLSRRISPELTKQKQAYASISDNTTTASATVQLRSVQAATAASSSSLQRPLALSVIPAVRRRYNVSSALLRAHNR